MSSRKIAKKKCSRCKDIVRATKNKPNHILHLILTICTGGLWLLVWIAVSTVFSAPWECDECGKRLSL